MRPIFVAIVLLVGAKSFADEDAKSLFDKGTAAFALGNYNEAAEDYERAFKLKPDPALLYNAAQAHRLAGNKTRALQLYQSYSRVYGKGISNRSEVEQRIAELKAAIENDQRVSNAPPTEPAPLAGHPEPAPPPSTTSEPAAPALTASAPPPEKKPLVKKPWFWVVVGGAVVVAVGVGLGVGLGTQKQNPSTTLTSIPVN
jgi:tetratricopeptide (TPR) repeat protein